MGQSERFLIGELAERAGVNRETLRYYERRGLLKPARRTAGGYRIYDEESAARLLFIKRAQGFGPGHVTFEQMIEAVDSTGYKASMPDAS